MDNAHEASQSPFERLHEMRAIHSRDLGARDGDVPILRKIRRVPERCAGGK